MDFPFLFRCILKLLPLQGALHIGIIPRALPWAKSFCPFRACWFCELLPLHGVWGKTSLTSHNDNSP